MYQNQNNLLHTLIELLICAFLSSDFGDFSVGSIWYLFKWPKEIVQVPFKWFSFCIVYNNTDSSVILSINNMTVFQRTDKKFQVN